MKMMGDGDAYNDYNDFPDGDQDEDEDEETINQKKSNLLPVWGNEKTMNLNTLVLTNIQSSQYFKVKLYALKTYHEVLDEIYYQVSHLEPWEKGSRKTAGQTGMCGGVRGVGAGGIVSTAYCILYKLFTLRLTRKQINGCINHTDSPYIRGLGLMYIRYTQPPADLWIWLEPYLEDDEELDVRAGGGQSITIGAMCRHLLTKLDWHSTLFPRIPVPIQKDIEKKIQARDGQASEAVMKERLQQQQQQQGPARAWKESGGGVATGGGRTHGQSPIPSNNGRALSRDRHNSKDQRAPLRGSRDPVSKDRSRHPSRDPISKDRSRHPSRDKEPPARDRLSKDREPRSRDKDRLSRDRGLLSRDRDRRSRDKDGLSRDKDRHSKVRARGSRDRDRSPKDRDRSPKDRERHRDRSKDRSSRKERDHHKRDRERRDVESTSRRRSRDRQVSRDTDSRDKHKRDRKDKDGRRHHRSRSGSAQDFSADLQREKERIKSRHRSRSRSRDRDRKHR